MSAGSCCLSVFVVIVCDGLLFVGCWLLIGVCSLLLVLFCPPLCSAGVCNYVVASFCCVYCVLFGFVERCSLFVD